MSEVIHVDFKYGKPIKELIKFLREHANQPLRFPDGDCPKQLKAILRTREGFLKEFLVSNPPPREYFVPKFMPIHKGFSEVDALPKAPTFEQMIFGLERICEKTALYGENS